MDKKKEIEKIRQALWHPQRIRHISETELLTKGSDIPFISVELEHADLETTKIFTRIHDTTNNTE
ncbi:site-specific recombinase XerD [Peribacillus deserti]|uniref:Site-specific recombinase XerD n=1 Tax=Peribacillus deserti TaxID=673318 RepID=A0ABS2QC56_9BACI|nr:tyrosine-type recombinase/integrase [Peribacillus deserti]MBM7690752.1 site-specific recombinase XerD [Peribacillus deserti]